MLTPDELQEIMWTLEYIENTTRDWEYVVPADEWLGVKESLDFTMEKVEKVIDKHKEEQTI